MQREQWASRLGFVMAASGSAIGLGNIWRFPYIAYDNGGGAFLIPYFFALLTAGIPILLLEFGIGRSQGGSAPLSFRRLSSRFEWLGWWQVMISFVIAVYYVAVIVWAINYFFFSFTLKWGSDTGGFLFGSFLGVPDDVVTDSGWNLGGIQWLIFVTLVIVWAVAYYVLYSGVRKGIERANKVLMPILIVVMILFVIRAVTLDNAVAGLNHLFTPDFAKIVPFGSNPEWYKVWIAAYGQVFFSMSIAFAIMVTYSSYLDKKTDVNNSGFIMAFANSGFEFLAAIGVFAALGFMAGVAGTDVSEVAAAGVGLAFVVFPQIINEFPFMNGFFGALFFLSLVLAGFTSFISILEVIISAVMDKLRLTRKAAVSWVIGICFVVSIAFTTGAGIILLDIVDHFINAYGIVVAGLIEVILLGWFSKKLDEIRRENNLVSDFAVGKWWNVMIIAVTPLALLIMTVLNLYNEFKANYEGYPTHAILTFGWIMLLLSIVVAFVLAYAVRWKDNPVPVSAKQEVSG
jgi:NSS family neurotransmitter:Na+ symporter